MIMLKWVIGEVLVLVNLLEGYGSNNIRLRVVDYMVFNYDCNHFHQRLLPAIYQFYEPDQ